MKWLKLSIIISACLIWTLYATYGQSTEQADPPKPAESANIYHCPNHPDITATWAAKCPHCGENLVRRQEQPRQSASANARASWMRRNMMLHTSIDVYDPEAILSARRILGLNQEQIEKLRELSRNARQSAIKVLTDDQRKELSAASNLPNHPRTMAQMHRRMLQSMPASDAATLNLMLQRRNTQARSRTNDPPAQDPPVQQQNDAAVGNINSPEVVGSVFARDTARDQVRDRDRDQYRDQLRDRDADRNRNQYRFYYYEPYGYGYNYTWPYYWPYTWPYSEPYIYPEPYYYYYQNQYPYNYNYPYQLQEYNLDFESPQINYSDEFESNGFGDEEFGF